VESENYKLRYLPQFEKDMLEVTNYISKKLENPRAALRLIDDTEQAIKERLKAP
jgi:hypothetical protein